MVTKVIGVFAIILAVAFFLVDSASAQRSLAEATADARAEGEKKTSVPRTKEGRPDFTGGWTAPGVAWTYAWEAHEAGFGTFSEGPSIIGDPLDGLLPYQPWALKERERRRLPENAYEENYVKCTVTGIPRLLVYPFGIQQYPDKVVFFYWLNITTRVVRFDSRPPLPGSIRLWMGDARGRWEGDTLVVETTNLNGKGWLNLGGDIMSDAMRVVERYRMLNATTMSLEAVIDDPKVYTRPWTIKFPAPHVRSGGPVDAPEFDFEDSCLEGNVNLKHFKNMYDAARKPPSR